MRHRRAVLAINALAAVAGATHLASGAGPDQPPAAAHTSAAALAAVMHIYDPYTCAANDTPVLGDCFFSASGRPCPPHATGVMTASLKIEQQLRARIQDADPVDCAQNTPQRVTSHIWRCSTCRLLRIWPP